jgi:hypothetical protein
MTGEALATVPSRANLMTARGRGTGHRGVKGKQLWQDEKYKSFSLRMIKIHPDWSFIVNSWNIARQIIEIRSKLCEPEV